MDQKTPKEPSALESFSPARKERARAWFEHLRDRICASLEAVEDAADGCPAARASHPAASSRRPGRAARRAAKKAAAA